jgi:hypothetical protein
MRHLQKDKIILALITTMRDYKDFVGVLWLACFKMTSANTYLPTKISEFVVLANIFKQSLFYFCIL